MNNAAGSPRLPAASVNGVLVLRHLASNVFNQIFGTYLWLTAPLSRDFGLDLRLTTLISG